ncbi:linear amide C-N hydrolase [Paludisphaera mucosa]|uniref:Linear amide C-N hydrolase n=1 Tax=Paludisphaera mucosa TaxID=3030827 RepID=A0ABT6FHJ4_9BACT|nr:linear amide C-N hydrolase [Paludisphaera mucosa]MDG3006956.1 linear amide C-N hydrolase [Paludisphaera mucosa]
MNAKRLVGMVVAGLACGSFGLRTSEACTRCVYLGPDDRVLVARSMDWSEDPGTNLYCLPRGMRRNGTAGPHSLAWTSKYGSVVCSFYEIASVDGMNEKGLVANTLYLVESDYGKAFGNRPTISISAWTQYVLDNFATVAEAVEALRAEPFTIIAPILPNKQPAQGHLAIADPTGDSAIFEYVKGKLVIHHGREFQVMTNSPTYDQQLALNAYWQEIGGTAMLPGTSRAADRFARASYYIHTIPPTSDAHRALASLFGVIRNASVPLGVTTPGQPNISGTVWRTAYDLKDRVLYFDSATSPTVFWTPLAKMDFEPGAPVKKLTLTGGRSYAGDASAEFQPAPPFPFLPGAPD